MYKVTITIKHGRDYTHIHKQYDHSLLLDEAENEVLKTVCNYLSIMNLALEYIGRWEWTVKIDDRIIAHTLWTVKG